MIKKQQYYDKTLVYSTEHKYILQVETGIIYDVALEESIEYTYQETEEDHFVDYTGFGIIEESN